MAKPPISGEIDIGKIAAPRFVKLPDPLTIFARRSERLAELARDHPMQDFLAFMATLAAAQAAAAGRLPAARLPLAQNLALSQRHGMPPLGPDHWRRDACWRDGLDAILADPAFDSLPAQARAAVGRLRGAGAGQVEELADAFLGGTVPAEDRAAAIFAAAALQVYWTRMATRLDAGAVTPIEHAGLCPVCGSPPVAGVVQASDDAPGSRYLHCSLCATAWHYIRVKCANCGSTKGIAFQEIEGGDGGAKAETCTECRTYTKIFYQQKALGVEPLADDLATLALDVVMAEAGWDRAAPNPFILAA